MALTQYDPKALVVTLGPVLVSGFAPDTFLAVEKNNDTFSLQIGADGEATRTRSRDNSGKVTVTLMQGAAANDLLQAVHELDRVTPAGAGTQPLLVKDLFGRTLFAAERAWIVKPAPSEFAAEAGTREWVIESDDLRIFVGGST